MKRLITIIIGCTVAFSCVSFSGCEKKDDVSIANNEKVKTLNFPKQKNDIIDLDLYFNSSKEGEMAKEERAVNKEEVIGELIMQELLKGPSVKSSLSPILPKETRLLSFSIKDGIAYVNLSSEAEIPMKKLQEKVSIQSIVNSLTQLDSIKKVKILIENKDVETLGGNYNIYKPLSKYQVDGMK